MTFAQATVSIAAPLELVWKVMLDLDSYGEWNPFIVKVRKSGGPQAQVGDDLVLHVRFKGGKKVASPERITQIEGPAGGVATLEYEFRGPLHVTGMIRGRRRQILSQGEDGTTSYRTEERFRGLLAFATPVGAVQDGFERHAAALKQRAEELDALAA